MSTANQESVFKIRITLESYQNLFKKLPELFNQLKISKDIILNKFNTSEHQKHFNDLLTELENSEEKISSVNELLKLFLNQFEEKYKPYNYLPQYIQIIERELSFEGDLDTCIPEIKKLLQIIDSEEFNVQETQFLIKLVEKFKRLPIRIVYDTLERFTMLKNFEHFNTFEKSFVIIGANGSGKSLFSRKSKYILKNNDIVILPAQKIFFYNKISGVTFNQTIDGLQKEQANDNLIRNKDDSSAAVNHIQRLVQGLITEYVNYAIKVQNGLISFEDRELTKYEKVINLWNEVFELTNRSLEISNEDHNINVLYKNNKYSFNELSDGEKAVFFYIANVLLAKSNSFIIVDEPENHLHLNMTQKLWNRLEQERIDCKFIYVTHDLNFASAKTNAKKLWIKEYIHPNKWDIQELPENKEIPETLLMELLGTRKPILFCEGDNNSIDVKLYRVLFPDFHVTPVNGGHYQVINHTTSFNSSKNIHNNKAIGIIDGDYHRNDAIKKWENKKVFCLPVNEVENILCDEIILNAKTNNPDKLKEKILSKMKKNQSEEHKTYLKHYIDNEFDREKISKKADLTAIKNEINSLAEKMISEIDNVSKIHQANFTDNLNNYEHCIMHYSMKNILQIVLNDLNFRNKEELLDYLSNKDELIKSIRAKYFEKVDKFLSDKSV